MKNRRAIITLFGANLISGVAQGITMIAIPWYFVLQGKMGVFAYVFMAANLVALFWVPSAGIIVDRYNRKRIFQALTFVIGTLLLCLSCYGQSIGGLPWYLVGAAFMMTFFNYNIHYPTIYAFMQEVTEEKYYDKISSALEIQGQLATMTAGASAAWLLEGTLDGQLNLFGFHFSTDLRVEPWQIEQILMLDAVTYFIAFLVISTIVFVPLKQRVKEIGGLLTRLKIGISYLTTHKEVMIFGVASHSIFVTVMVLGYYLDPLYVSNHLKASGDVYASVDIYYGFAAILAGFLIHQVFKGVRIPRSIAAMCFTMGAIYLLLFATRNVLIFYAAAFVIGLCNPGTRILRVTYLFRNIPNQVFGRAASIFTMINTSFRILFLLIFSIPFFTAGNNVIWAFVAMSFFVVLSGLVLLWFDGRYGEGSMG